MQVGLIAATPARQTYLSSLIDSIDDIDLKAQVRDPSAPLS